MVICRADYHLDAESGPSSIVTGVRRLTGLPFRQIYAAQGGPVMRPRCLRLSLALALSLMLIGSIAWAGPKEDVAAATVKWAEAIGTNDPDKVLPLYAPDAVLWGTLSPTVRADQATLRDYFVTAFKVLPRLKVTFGDQLIRVNGETAINTGNY